MPVGGWCNYRTPTAELDGRTADLQRPIPVVLSDSPVKLGDGCDAVLDRASAHRYALWIDVGGSVIDSASQNTRIRLIFPASLKHR